MNSLPGTGVTRSQRSLVRIARCKQEEQLGLKRIGILEFVDEDSFEPLLEVPPHGGVIVNEITRAQQQIEEVESAFPLLEQFVMIDTLEQIGVQQRRQVGVGANAGTRRAPA